MKTLRNYIIHLLTHKWIEDQHEGPFTSYKCNKCERTFIQNLTY
jgi:hypothetical protein